MVRSKNTRISTAMVADLCHSQRTSKCFKAAAPAIQMREGSLFQSQHFYRNNIVAQLSNKPAYPISLKQMVAFGKDIDERKLISSANFVRPPPQLWKGVLT